MGSLKLERNIARIRDQSIVYHLVEEGQVKGGFKGIFALRLLGRLLGRDLEAKIGGQAGPGVQSAPNMVREEVQKRVSGMQVEQPVT